MKIKYAFMTFSIFVAISIVLVIVAEGVIRRTAPQVIQPRFMINSGFGNRVPAPNRSYEHSVPGDYRVTINTNSFGGRGARDYAPEKDRGVHRICVLGDSFAFGYGVEDDEVVSAVLERRLNERASNDSTYEVLNFGVSGYGQAEQLNLYLNRVRNYHCADIVMFYFSNDPGNNVVSSLYKPDGAGGVVRDRQEYLPGVAIQENLYGFPVLGNWFAHSHLWSVIRYTGSRMRHRQLLEKKGLKSYSTADTGARDLTVALIRTMESGFAADGVRLIIFVIPKSDMQTNFPFEQLSELQGPVIDGRAILSKDDYHAQDGHWNAAGHEKAADLLLALYEPAAEPDSQDRVSLGSGRGDQGPLGAP